MTYRVYMWSRGLQVGFVDFDDQDSAQSFAELITQRNGLSSAEVQRIEYCLCLGAAAPKVTTTMRTPYPAYGGEDIYSPDF